MKKVYVVGYSTGYSRFIHDMTLVNKIEDADIVLFTGGEDISPELYGCKIHETTYFTRRRDQEEIEAFNKIRPNQLAVGICRGAQLFCALNGGILVQHCTGHCGVGHHMMINSKGEEYEIPSIHHQMQFPFYMPSEDYEVLFKASNRLSSCYEGDKVDEELIKQNGEPEVVLYHKEGKPKCLGIQGHPEMMLPNCNTVNMINGIIDELLGIN